jgi:hypothetical protein
MTADQVVVLDVLVPQSQKITSDEVQPLSHIGWLERRSASRGLEERVGDVKTDNVVTETGKFDCLRSLSAPSVKHPQRLVRVGRLAASWRRTSSCRTASRTRPRPASHASTAGSNRSEWGAMPSSARSLFRIVPSIGQSFASAAGLTAA